MRKLFSLTVLAAAMATATAAQAPDGPVQRDQFCYMECQYRCYVTNPGGGPDWTQCYLDCARERCGWNG